MKYDLILERWALSAPPSADVRRVIGWTAYNEIESRAITDVGAMWGGFMTEGDDWNAFIDKSSAEEIAYAEALRAAVLERGLKRGGDWHQWAPDGVPVFDDGAVATFTFRGWGDLMAAVWTGPDARGYKYLDFYMDSCLRDAGIALSPPLSEEG